MVIKVKLMIKIVWFLVMDVVLCLFFFFFKEMKCNIVKIMVNYYIINIEYYFVFCIKIGIVILMVGNVNINLIKIWVKSL